MNDESRQVYGPIFREFPTLETARVPERVAEEIGRRAPEWFPLEGAVRAEMGKLYVKPHKYIRIVYHFFTPADETRPAAHVWVVGRVLHRKASKTRKKKHARESLSIWDDNLRLQPFTRDERLDRVQKLVDSAWVLKYMQKNRSRFPIPESANIREVCIDPFKYVPGKRMLLRYRIRFDAGSSSTYAKYYFGEQGKRSAAVQDTISRALKECGSHASVPRVYLYDSKRQLMFQEDWNGQPLKGCGRILEDRARLRSVLAAARELHELDVPAEVKNRIENTRYIFKLRKDVEDISLLMPEREEELRALCSGLKKVLGRSEPQRRGLLHGSFLPSQILVRGGEIGFVDFDGAGIGDPLYDVSELLTSFIHDEWRQGTPVASLHRLWDAAMQDFADVYGYVPCPEKVAACFLMFFLNKTHKHMKKIRSFPEGGLENLDDVVHHHLERAGAARSSG